MQQTQKKENKFPVFDLVLILVIALAVAGGVFWVTTRQNVQKVDIVYTVRFENVSNEYGGRIAEGKTVYTAAGNEIGVVQSVEVSRSVRRTFDGTVSEERSEPYSYSESVSEEYSNVTATVRVTADEKAGGFFLGDQRIAGGMTVRVMIGGFAADGAILTVEKEAEE